MNLNLAEALLLLALDDEKGKFISESLRLSFSLGGAILLELSLNDRIELIDDRVKLKKTSPMRDSLLNDALDKIKAVSKDKKTSYWINKFGNRATKIRKELIERFIERGILEKKEEKILWIFPNNKYPTQNPELENTIRQQLKNVVLHKEQAQERDVLLLSLLRVCKLTKEVFGEAAEREEIKERITQIIENEKLGVAIQKAVQNVEAAIAITTTMVAVNAAIS